MSEQAKSEDKSSHTTSGIAIIAILLSMFAVQDTILKPTRPPMVNTERAFGEDARSRLWQDPFQAVEEHRKYQQAQENPSRPISEFEVAIDTTHSQRQKYKIISETKGSKHVVIEMPSLDENYAYEYGREPTRVCFDKAEQETRAPDGYSASKAIAYSFDALHCEMEKETKGFDSRNVHVLAVMVPGGPYAEDKERRLRSRYAVISALAEHGYASTDPEHIDFLDFEATCKAMLRKGRAEKLRGEESSNKEGFRICELPDFMPYEWFRPIPGGSNNDRIQRILLLWLNNDAFARSEYPLNLLGFLKKEIYKKMQEKEKIESYFSVVGPHGSDLLYKMYREVIANNRLILSDDNYKSIDKNASIYTATATITRDHLFGEYRLEGRPAEQVRWKWLNKMITRTVSMQDATVNALLCELMLRGINPYEVSSHLDYDLKIKKYCDPEIELEIPRNKSEQSHIVLIGEKDNLYSQKLTENFRKLMSRSDSNDKTDGRDGRVHFFSYLRGLDGITSEQPSASQENKNRRSGESQENKSAEIKEQRERPVGTSQLDYLIGLAEEIKQLDRRYAKDGGIKAIGITGTDTYDKLLILQALRSKFPGVIFFTTDLDARLFHPSEIKWTRNLIVASPFGLKLSEKVQPSTPPFRDNFQTSIFLSARLALCEKGAIEDPYAGCDVINQEKDNWTRYPRIFEIGNYGAVDISHQYKSIFPLSSIKVKEKSLLYFITPKIVLASVLIVSFTAMIIFIFIPREFHYKLMMATIIPMSLILCYFLIDFYDTVGEEPISFTNGISSWPSNGIKILASSILIGLGIVIYSKLIKSHDDTKKIFIK